MFNFKDQYFLKKKKNTRNVDYSTMLYSFLHTNPCPNVELGHSYYLLYLHALSSTQQNTHHREGTWYVFTEVTNSLPNVDPYTVQCRVEIGPCKK